MEHGKRPLKIMLTGAHGFVGARAAEKFWDAIIVPGHLVRTPGEALTDFVKEHAPDIILNAAAISDIGACERDPEGSYTANVTLPVVLARAARETGAKLVSFSSDQVYTGCKTPGPYAEDEPLPPPANLYARHKLEAEALVLDIAPDAVLLRATWMYDMPLCGHANRGNFLMNVIKAIMGRERMKLSPTYQRGITYVRQVVDLLPLAFSLPGGVYNYGSENPLSMYDTAKALVKALGYEALGEALIEVDPTPRHNLWMDCEKIRAHGILFDSTEEGIAQCMQDYLGFWMPYDQG